MTMTEYNVFCFSSFADFIIRFKSYKWIHEFDIVLCINTLHLIFIITLNGFIHVYMSNGIYFSE